MCHCWPEVDRIKHIENIYICHSPRCEPKMQPPAPKIYSLQWHDALTSHSRRLPCGAVPVPQAPSPQLTQSNPNLSGQQHHGSSEVGTLQCQNPAHRCLHSQGPALNEDNVSATTPGRVTQTSLHIPHRQIGKQNNESWAIMCTHPRTELASSDCNLNNPYAWMH